MADHLGRMFRFYALLAILPLAAGFFGVWSLAIGYLLFLLVAAGLIAMLIGTLIWIDRGMKLPVERRQRALLIGLAPLLFAVSVVVVMPLFDAGNFFASLIRLTIDRDHYEAIIAKAGSVPGERYGQDGNIDYITVPGPPVRVAFRHGDMRQPWGATVYDPSGDVMLAKGHFDQSGLWIAPASVRDLGMITGCRHLWGDYYTCWEYD
ncbi:hypothetical protein P1X14_11385 [Sphingomonas sp. AOB5]|uniref:hypothetical protein n=1 Tax=Sphingomonas sp. AOB5 TaxID=3034017 RepID=UPI0023F9744F|nr:hypothetical protein [Sphingomonas sp. AOB5]MDF7775851.1 hypothetical protein [Sphingomonas sp. AOB5]